jgi:hypothetical protein
MPTGTIRRFQPHIITAHQKDGSTRYYVRSVHAADVYYRIDAVAGRLTCTCPTGQQGYMCEHVVTIAEKINTQREIPAIFANSRKPWSYHPNRWGLAGERWHKSCG